MEVRISILEVSTKIAETRIREELLEANPGSTEQQINDLMFEQNSTTIYTPAAQAIYDVEYPKYYALINDAKIPGIYNYGNPDIYDPNANNGGNT